MKADLVILDERGYLLFSQVGGALLVHLTDKLYEHTRLAITINLSFAEWASVFGDAKITTALLGGYAMGCTSAVLRGRPKQNYLPGCPPPITRNICHDTLFRPQKPRSKLCESDNGHTREACRGLWLT